MTAGQWHNTTECAWLTRFAACRAERKLDQVCSDQEYRIVFDRVNALPAGVEHLVVQLGGHIGLLDESILKPMIL